MPTGPVGPSAPPKRGIPSLYNGSWKTEFSPRAIESIVTPRPFQRKGASPTPRRRSRRLKVLYSRNTNFLRDSFAALAAWRRNNTRYRAFYPEFGVSTTFLHAQIDSRQAYGHMPTPGHFSTTITRPDAVRDLSDRAAAADHPQPWRAHHGRRVDDADPAAFCLLRGPACRRRPSPKASIGRSATCSMCPTSTAPTTTSPTAPSRRRPASLGRWRRSPRSGSTIRCTGCRTTRQPARAFPELRAVHQLPVLH